MADAPEARTPRVLVVDPSLRGGLVHHSWVVSDALAHRVPTTLLATTPYELDAVERRFTLVAKLRPWPARGGRSLGSRALSALRALAVALRNWIVIAVTCRRIRPDVVLFSNVPTNHPSGPLFRPPYLDALMIGMIRRLGGAVVVMVHDVPLGGRIDGTRALARAADGVLSHRPLDDILPVDADAAVMIVPHPPYTLIAHAGERASAPVLDRVPPDAKLVVHPGYIETYKGTDVVIEAFARVEAEVRDAWLIVAGEETDAAFGARCRELLERLALTRVIYTPRFLAIGELGAILRRATVTALPYRAVRKSAASGIVYAALACASRVVASADGAFEDVASHPGLEVVPPDDPSALAAAIVRALGAGRLPEPSPDGWSSSLDDILKLFSTAIDARHGGGRR